MKALLSILSAALVLALPAAAAAPSITVPDTTYAGTTVATVGTQHGQDGDSYVFVRCYTPDFQGAFVYAAYFPIVDKAATLGPLWSTLWPGGAADCTAEQVWFTGRGFGEMKVTAETTFHVADPDALTAAAVSSGTLGTIRLDNHKPTLVRGGSATFTIYDLDPNVTYRVNLFCYQHGAEVLAASEVSYADGVRTIDAVTFFLEWASGAAKCDATLVYLSDAEAFAVDHVGFRVNG